MPYGVVAAGIASVSAYFLSFNVWLWLEAGVALLVSIALIYRQQRTYPALMWVLCFNWLSTVAAILTADLQGMNLGDTDIGPFRVKAVQLSLVSLFVFAVGIASGLAVTGKGNKLIKERGVASVEYGIDLRRGLIAYLGTLIVAEIGMWLMQFLPQLHQQLYMLQMLKFVCVYLVAWTVMSTGRGHLWLLAMLAIEVVIGMTGFFGSFKEPFFVALIALFAMGRRPSMGKLVFGAVTAICVITLSLIWTSVKKEYRPWVSGGTGQQIVVRSFGERANWMLDNISFSAIDSQALQTMTTRIDNTAIYAEYLARADVGYVIDLPSRYLAAFKNIVMPRVLFPDKGNINDSIVTTAMTGRLINDNTSISIGYIAEAHYDFGIPWMFVPIFLMGVAMALAGRYFTTREAPYVIRQAFATTLLFNSLLFGSNIDKTIGGFVMQFIVLALVLKFAYPRIAGWLASRRRMPKRLPQTVGRRMRHPAHSHREGVGSTAGPD